MKPDFMAPGPKVRVEKVDASINFENNEKDPHDPVSALDPEQRPTRYHESNNILGKLYRLVDEKGFYESLRKHSHVSSKDGQHYSIAMDQLWKYILRAAEGIQFKSYMTLARDIREMYDYNVSDLTHTYALHPSLPLHEVEVVSGCVLGSVFNRRLRDVVGDMRQQYAEHVAYTRTSIRMDDDGNEDEALARSIACLYIAIHERGMKVGKEGTLVSFKYVAAALCLEELEKFHNGLLKRV